jgi:hypothetical protein
MMLGMHPWIGLADGLRLGLLTEWVTAGPMDEVLAECGRRDKKPRKRFQPDSWSSTAAGSPASPGGLGADQAQLMLGPID